MALEAKKLGNESFQNKNYTEAVKWFSEAIKLDDGNHVLYSNRSGAFAAQGKYMEALEDAKKTVKIKADWAKGYSRMGTALVGLGRFDEAIQEYEKGLKLEPTNAATKESLEEARKAKERASQQQQQEAGINDIFSQAFKGDIFGKIRMNPKLAPYLSQPDFIGMVVDIQKNPQNISKYLKDKRIMELITSLLNFTTQGEDEPMQEEVKREEPKETKQETKQETKAEPKPTPMETEKTQTNEDKQADKEKQLGNDAYKAKKFDEAINHYSKAHQLVPTNVVYLTNRAAAYFEAGKFDECIKDCDLAIEEGRKQRADYKQIAKAFTRIGNAHMKLHRYNEAMDAYNHSLTEDRTPETLTLYQKAEKLKKENDIKAYLDPQISTEAKDRGNEFFKQGKFPEAIAEYSEAIKRNPEDHTLYSNRAACYTKIMQYDLGLKDCDECIKRKPDFVKAYTRKGHILFFMKDYQKALVSYDAGLKFDENNTEIKESIQRTIQSMNVNSANQTDEERLQNAMRNPEVQEILSDPVMRQILGDMESNPDAARDHLKNPLVAAKIQKLIAAGVLKIR